MKLTVLLLGAMALLSGCQRVQEIGQVPEMSPIAASDEHLAMMSPSLPIDVAPIAGPAALVNASLWTGERGSLLGDRRAMTRGDILTVVIEIDDSASINNSSDRSRSSSQNMGVEALLGIPDYIRAHGVEGFDPNVGVTSSSAYAGDGTVSRNEKLELRVAATVMNVLPNGVLEIAGRQEVRVNNEIRELLVEGYVRPADITRQNEITYDKIAAARISYGGRGIVSDVQRPRYGDEALELLLPF